MLHPDFGEPSCLTKDVAVSSLLFLRHSTVHTIHCLYILLIYVSKDRKEILSG